MDNPIPNPIPGVHGYLCKPCTSVGLGAGIVTCISRGRILLLVQVMSEQLLDLVSPRLFGS
jgi:hypothetical protein